MKKLISLVLITCTVLLASDSFINEDLTKLSYRDYIKGSINGYYTVPSIDSKSPADESYGDSLSSLSIDLLLFEKYYGGLRLGYKKTFSNNGSDFYMEKEFGRFSIYYKNVTSKYDVGLNSKYGTNTVVSGDNSSYISNSRIDTEIDFRFIEFLVKEGAINLW